jgi:hypothetical protein
VDLARLLGHEVTVLPAARERAVPKAARPRSSGRERPAGVAPARKLVVLPRRNVSA